MEDSDPRRKLDTSSNARPQTAAERDASLRTFLESGPLYSRLLLEIAGGLESVTFPDAISGPCQHPKCRELPSTSWTKTASTPARPGTRLEYRCAHCQQMVRYFWVMDIGIKEFVQAIAPHTRVEKYSKFEVRKIGEYPAWAIKVPDEVARSLNATDIDLYRKALICMSQSYGLGAVAYFRRVVENAVLKLLDLVQEAADSDSDEKALAAVADARRAHNADEKLRLVADVVPPSLRPGGVNPLKALYGDYSAGLHGLSDERCLEIAAGLRTALEYVFGNLSEKLRQAKAYRDSISKRATDS